MWSEQRKGQWHDVPVMVVEQKRRRQQAMGAGPADQDQVVPVEVAAKRIGSTLVDRC